MNLARTQFSRWLPLLSVAFCVATFPLIFVKAMLEGINHDEHQFIAPAVLLARHGLQPYRDFPLFHLPVLTFIFAALDKVGSMPFLLARSFNALCAALGVCAVFLYAKKCLVAQNPAFRFLISLGFALIFLTSKLFVSTNGKAWNHDLPMLLTVCAVCLHIHAVVSREPAWILVLSGICIGLAIGARLTYAPLVAPFFLTIFLFPQTLRQRFIFAAWFSAAVAIALLPVWWYFATVREQFLFDNFQFPRLRLLDPTDERAHKTVKLWRKFRFFAKEVVCKDPAVFLAFALGLPGLLRGVRSRDFSSLLFASLLPFVLYGCFAPTRYQYQHFYVIAPFCIMAAARGFALWPWPRVQNWVAGTLLALAIWSVSMHARYREVLSKFAHPNEWVTVQTHQLGVKLRTFAGEGKVMTFAAIIPLEGGLDIYPEFATGPFAMRLAHLVPPARRLQMDLVARDDLTRFLDADPPVAILLGFEPELERSLKTYARRHHFHLAFKDRGQEFWIAPPR